MQISLWGYFIGFPTHFQPGRITSTFSLHSRISTLPTIYNIANATTAQGCRLKHPAVKLGRAMRPDSKRSELLTVTHQNGFHSTIHSACQPLPYLYFLCFYLAKVISPLVFMNSLQKAGDLLLFHAFSGRLRTRPSID